MLMNKKLFLSLCAASVMTISGCATVADMAGADTATLNITVTPVNDVPVVSNETLSCYFLQNHF